MSRRTTRAKWLLYPAVIGVVALVAGATPAHAATSTTRHFEGEAEFALTSCSKTAPIGTSCIVLVVGASVETQSGSPDQIEFSVDAGRSMLGAGWDITSSFVKQSSGLATAGSLTMSGSTAKLKFTINMTCLSAPCELSGPFTIQASLGRTPTSIFTLEASTVAQHAGPSCTETTKFSRARHLRPGGTGSAKFAGKTKSMKVWSPLDTGAWSIEQAKVTVKQTGPCLPEPVVVDSGWAAA